MQAQIDFYDQLERQYDDARNRLQGIKQELSSYDKIMTLLKDHINDNLQTQKRLLLNNHSSNIAHVNHHYHSHHHQQQQMLLHTQSINSSGGGGNNNNSGIDGGITNSGNLAVGKTNHISTTTNTNHSNNINNNDLNNCDDTTRKQTIIKESYDKLQAKYERFRVAKIEREDDYKRQLTEKIQLESHLNSMKAQIASIKKLQQAQEEQLNRNNQQRQQHESSFDYDVETINFLNECNWNLGDSCDRSLAETLLSCFPSGTFLVRSSKTKQNSFALSVVANSIVRHCLIDKLDNEEFCFHPPGPQRQTYSSLCNLVMDYRHKSLLRHNPELDTNLIYPVLSQLKKTSKGTSGGGGSINASST